MDSCEHIPACMQAMRKIVVVSLSLSIGFCAPERNGEHYRNDSANGTVSIDGSPAGKIAGYWAELHDYFVCDPDMTAVMLDSTVVRAHMCAVGGSKRGGSQKAQALGRSRGGFSSKIHIVVDAVGFPLRFSLTGGERHDITQAESLLAPFHFDAFIGDKGYDSDHLRDLLETNQVEVVVPSRRHRKQQRDYDKLRYKERNIVERFINKIKWYRRIFTRYEKLACRYIAFVHLAATVIWLD